MLLLLGDVRRSIIIIFKKRGCLSGNPISEAEVLSFESVLHEKEKGNLISLLQGKQPAEPPPRLNVLQRLTVRL